MTVLELLKESQRILGDINVPVKLIDTITAPIVAVHHNLGVVISTLEEAEAAEKQQQEAVQNEDSVQSENV